MSVKKKYLDLVGRIEKTGKKITVVVAAKYATDEQLKELVHTGATHFGENRAQDLIHHQDILKNFQLQASSFNLPKWHFIGHLQTNKINKVVGKIAMLQSLDSLQLAEALNKRLASSFQLQASSFQPSLPVLIEVNICRDPAKFGIDSDHLFDFVSHLTPFTHLSLAGLMTMGKIWDSEKEARTHFARMRNLFDSLKSLTSQNPPNSFPNLNPIHLSMGMSSDYQWAIEEGATMIRVGRVLFT